MGATSASRSSPDQRLAPRAGLSVCNPYTFFGLPHIWPRGYPLDQIKGEDCTSFARQPVRPLILQARRTNISLSV